MKIGAYAYNVGPGKMLEAIGHVAKQEPHSHEFVQNPVQKFPDVDALRESDVVLLGLSPGGRLREEIALARWLQKQNIPFLWVEDAGRTVDILGEEPEGGAALEAAAANVVALEDRVIDPRRDRYFGSPDHWSASYRDIQQGTQRRARGELRKVRRDDSDEHSLEREDRVLFVPGMKGCPEVMTEMTAAVIEAAQRLLGEHFVLAVNQHPAEPKEAQQPENAQRYERALAERRDIIESVWHVPPRQTRGEQKWSNPELAGASDVPIFAGKPTESITLALAHRMSAYWSGLLPRIEGPHAVPWFMASSPGVIDVQRNEDLEGALRLLLDTDQVERTRRHLERLFRVPEHWNTSKNIVASLPDILSRPTSA